MAVRVRVPDAVMKWKCTSGVVPNSVVLNIHSDDAHYGDHDHDDDLHVDDHYYFGDDRCGRHWKTFSVSSAHVSDSED